MPSHHEEVQSHPTSPTKQGSVGQGCLGQSVHLQGQGVKGPCSLVLSGGCPQGSSIAISHGSPHHWPAKPHALLCLLIASPCGHDGRQGPMP